MTDTAPTPAAEPPRSQADVVRLTLLSLNYLLDSIEISRGGADIIDRLLVAAVLDANVAPIKQDLALQAAYATMDAPPPESLRRPVSMNAIAQSLGLPFETVRRRIRRLTARGTFLTTPRGVILRQEILASPAFNAMTQARYDRLRRFHADLAAADLLPRITEVPALPIPDEPVRIGNRILSEYLMRCIEGVLRPLGDPMAGLVLLHILRANTERLADFEGALAFQPVTVVHVAERLNAPAETVRRRALFLEREGYCRRGPGGVAVSMEGLCRPALQEIITQNLTNLQRLFNHLARLGVMEAWRREAALSLEAGRDQEDL